MEEARSHTPRARTLRAGLSGWLLALPLVACTGEVVWIDDPASPGFRHRGIGYSIAHPGGESRTEWRKVGIEGADLAFRRDDGAALSVSSDCRKTRAPVGVLARHLTIGTSRDDLMAAGPVELGGDQGFSQTFETLEGESEVPVRVKAVTLASGACVFDFVAVARDPASFDAVELTFDRWWTSFRRAPAEPGSETGVARSEGP